MPKVVSEWVSGLWRAFGSPPLGRHESSPLRFKASESPFRNDLKLRVQEFRPSRKNFHPVIFERRVGFPPSVNGFLEEFGFRFLGQARHPVAGSGGVEGSPAFGLDLGMGKALRCLEGHPKVRSHHGSTFEERV